jgi:hypothetical protein
VNACQLREYKITVDNAHDLLDLAREWEVVQLEAALIEFIGKPENCVPLLIPSILHALSRHLDTISLESQLRFHILPLIGNNSDSLLTLPLSMLSRALSGILTFESSDTTFDRRPLFDFLVRSLDHYGPSASILFHNLSADVFTTAELAILNSHPHFQWCFVGESVGRTLISLIGENEKQRLLLSSLNDRQSKLISDLISRVSELESRIEILSGEIETRSASPDARFEAAIQNQNNHTESRFHAELKEQSTNLTKEIRSGIARTSKLEIELSELRKSIADREQRFLKANLAPFPIVHESVFSPSRSMDGLLRHLATVCGSAAAMLSRGLIEVRASSVTNENSKPE